MADYNSYLHRQLYGKDAAVSKKPAKNPKRLDVFGGHWSLLRSGDEDLPGMVFVGWSNTDKVWGGHNLITDYATDMDSKGKCYLKV